ncbi:MAG: hypothetical protein KH046_00610 [Stenotrophomonas maltophilia]|uniref:hypothetical protein n=1 Tax=Stenotrophomonas maltophilia TaxID=40324 RepID=UPI0013D92966|nr:hypothetical protein [Stenotrophomonas maltophilia]MBS4799321.1 hypothetical protein [Stenotrophomonas maltophilia]
MITKLFNNPHVLFQPTDRNGFNGVAIGASVDGGGMIVLEQEDRHVVISPDAVPELCRLLRKLQKEGANG